jgi:hypothetical protein
MDTRLTLKVGLLYRIHEGWVSTEVIAARLGVPIGQVVRVRDWLNARGYLERAIDAPVSRWVATLEFETLWNELLPGRACPLSFCSTARARGSLAQG